MKPDDMIACSIAGVNVVLPLAAFDAIERASSERRELLAMVRRYRDYIDLHGDGDCDASDLIRIEDGE